MWVNHWRAGAYTGFQCELLSSQARVETEGDPLHMLDLTAQLSVLGAGLFDDLPKDATSNYFNSETQWRIML